MMVKNKIFLTILFCFVFLFFGIGVVQGGGLCSSCSGSSDCGSGLECINGRCQPVCPPGQTCIPNPLKSCSLSHLVEMIAKLIFNISLIVAPIMIIIGGFFFVTAAGNAETIKTGRSIITWTLIGFSVILLARGIISLFIEVFVVE